MTETEKALAANLAVQTAQAELLRIVIAEMCMMDRPNRDSFHARLKAIEEAAVNGLLGRRLFDHVDDATETYIKEVSASYASSLLSRIRHPDDPRI